jgi:YVTN family beta-propeller protein
MKYPRAIRATASFIAYLPLVSSLVFAQSGVHNQTPTSGLISRNAIVLNPLTDRIYAVDGAHSAVEVIDGKTHAVSQIKVGKDPLAVAVNTATGLIYVANHGSGTVSVLDGKTDRLLATIDVGPRPYSLAADPATNKIYVSNVYSNKLSVIDGATNTVQRIDAGSFDVITIGADPDSVFLLSYESSRLTLLHGSSMSNVQLGAMHLWGVAEDREARTLYISRIGSGDIVALDERTHAVTPIGAGKMPCAVAVNTKTKTIYVANYVDETLTIIDGKALRPVATVKVGRHPQAVAVDESKNLAYVANTLDSTVTAIDGSTHKVIATLPAGKNPYALAVDSATGGLYAADQGGPAFTQIDTRVLRKADR